MFTIAARGLGGRRWFSCYVDGACQEDAANKVTCKCTVVSHLLLYLQNTTFFVDCIILSCCIDPPHLKGWYVKILSHIKLVRGAKKKVGDRCSIPTHVSIRETSSNTPTLVTVIVLTDLPAGHHCRLHGNAGSPDRSRTVCAQPRPPSRDTPAVANQLALCSRQMRWERAKSVCLFLGACVGGEMRPHRVDPADRMSGASVELETRRKKADKTFGFSHLLRETPTFSSC